MKKKLIIAAFLFVLAGVIFAVQMPGKDVIRCVTKFEAQKAFDVVESMLHTIQKRDPAGFRECWNKDLGMDKINEYCKSLASPVAREFILTEALTRNDAPNTVILIGSFDSNPHNHKVILNKNGDTYRIAEIKELN